MAQGMNEVDALRTHIRHLKHAVATTTCQKTVDMLRQMLRETEAICARLNHTPRKCLDYRTPHGVLTARLDLSDGEP